MINCIAKALTGAALAALPVIASPQSRLIAWGSNGDGQCNIPALPPGVNYVRAGAGEMHSAALRSDGSMIAWGSNVSGQCNVPPLPTGLTYVTLSVGSFINMALTSEGSIVAWGSTAQHGLGDVPGLPPGVTYVQVSTAAHHALALRSDGSVSAWGGNYSGECDVPAFAPGRTCVEVVAAGVYQYVGGYSLALFDDGSVVGWGNNAGGHCDAPALPAGVRYVDIDASGSHVVGQRSDGAFVAWGRNENGQSRIPPLPPGLTYVEMSAGAWHTLARRSDDSVIGWGDRAFGLCNVPPTPPGYKFTDIVAGKRHNFAFIAPSCAPATTYCTAGTTANGCVPSIAAIGQASASAGDGFVISVSSVEGAQSGLIFYGLSGATASPWVSSSSMLCVAAPVQRTPIRDSGGTLGACDGSLSLDWNAYIAGTHGALGAPFVGGELVFAQGWFRDPVAPKSTALSDGLQFGVCP